MPSPGPLDYFADPNQFVYLSFLALIELQRISKNPPTKFYCMGTLLDRSTVVTSAQCLNGFIKTGVDQDVDLDTLSGTLTYRVLLVNQSAAQNTADLNQMIEYSIANISVVYMNLLLNLLVYDQ
jgi:hypothetical protein